MQDVDFQTGDALLIIDVQNDFLMGGALAVPEGEQVIPVINTLIAQARLKQIPIIASRDWHPKNHCSFKAQGGAWPVHCVANTEGADYHPFINLPDDCIHLYKATEQTTEVYSAAQGHTNSHESLYSILKNKSVKRVWLCGLALDYCVKASALDLAKEKVETIVILPATRAIMLQARQTSIEELMHAGVMLIEEL
ncbi:MAG: hypothetical protein A3F17_02280 [Gammaproteobacteria bacterium RIFCSPHIGHO2_12_FULL_41_15]|nr:MAG: hypothetical protein A3F17_02280 [Gammaproteobacteria bacterium RIFCSPHIGHO2_12_FULL_41_15]